MLTEGDLASSIDQTDKVREMQDKIANLRAQVIDRLFHVYISTRALTHIGHNCNKSIAAAIATPAAAADADLQACTVR